jgi:hypothetical protein
MPAAADGSNMPVPGYDPSDVDDMLESHLTDQQLADMLSDAEREAYASGEVGLVDLLSDAEIERIVERRELDRGE